MHTDEPQTLLLKVKGERVVTAADIKPNSEAEIVNPEEMLATLTAKNSELDMKITVERGLGYSVVESRKAEKLAIGTIGIDAFFSPVIKVNYATDNMRVGDRTDYNRLRLEIETDGTVSPSSALHKSANILKDHFEKALAVTVQDFGSVPATEEKPKKRTRASKTKTPDTE